MSKTRLWVYGQDGDRHLGVITVNKWACSSGKLVLDIEKKKVKPKQLDNGILDGKGHVVVCYRNDKGDKFQDHYCGVTLKDTHGTYTIGKNGALEEAILTSFVFTYKSIVKKVRRADCLLPAADTSEEDDVEYFRKNLFTPMEFPLKGKEL
jgi:hypothetical protein